MHLHPLGAGKRGEARHLAGGRERALDALGDDRLGDGAGAALVAEQIDDVGDALFGPIVDDIGGGRPVLDGWDSRRGEHAHVERAVVLE